MVKDQWAPPWRLVAYFIVLPLEGRKQFFFEKKNQKTFVLMAYGGQRARDSN
jgi:hypothetical protein